MSDVKDDGTTYKFEGWYTEKKGGERVYSTADVEGDSTVYAHWEDAGHEHTWDEWKTTKEATCDTKGERERTCKTCGKVQTGSIDALGHKWGDWKTTKDASCEEGGSQERKCSRCGATDTRSTDPLGHDWHTTKEPTCESEGEATCQRCGKTKSIDKITDGCGGDDEGGGDSGGDEGGEGGGQG